MIIDEKTLAELRMPEWVVQAIDLVRQQNEELIKEVERLRAENGKLRTLGDKMAEAIESLDDRDRDAEVASMYWCEFVDGETR